METRVARADDAADATARAAASAARRARARRAAGDVTPAKILARVNLDEASPFAREAEARVGEAKTLDARLEDVPRGETRRRARADARERGERGESDAIDVYVGVRAIEIAPGGATYVGGDDGVTTRLASGTTESFYPDLSRDGAFVNGQTPVRTVQFSKSGEEMLIGYDNGGWIRVSLKNGLTVSSSAPHEDFSDVFKCVNVKKLSKYANTAPQCRAMISNDDLSVIYLASPCLRDGKVYVWDLNAVREEQEAATTVDDAEEPEFDHKIALQENGKVFDIDGIEAYDRWIESLHADDPAAQRAMQSVGTVKHLEFHTDCVTSLVRVRGALISGANDSHIAVWDLKSIHKASKPHSTTRMTSAVSLMATNKSECTLFSAGADGSIRVYEVQGKGGKLNLHWLRSVGGQEGRVTSLCAVKSEPFVVVGSAKVEQQNENMDSVIRGDGDVSIWRITDGKLMFRSNTHDADVTTLTLGLNGKSLLSGDAKGKICKFALGKRALNEVRVNSPIRKGFLL